MTQGRYRNWVFTVNNPDTLLDPSEWPKATYVIYSEEVSESGTHHFQGYLELSGAHPLDYIKGFDGLERAHLEQRRGTQAQAIAYARKTDDTTFIDGPYVWGNPKAQGERTDLNLVNAMVHEGATLRTIAEENPVAYIKFHGGISKLHAMMQPKRRPKEKPTCFVFFGAGGTGKTTFASLLASYLAPRSFSLAMPKGSGTYWDGYEQGDAVIINEFNGSRCSPQFFNSLVDGGAFSVPIHGGSVEFNSPVIIITTNVHPGFWWRTNLKHSLMRRIVLFPTFRRLDGPCWKCPQRAISWDNPQFTHSRYNWRAAHAAGAHAYERAVPIDVDGDVL